LGREEGGGGGARSGEMAGGGESTGFNGDKENLALPVRPCAQACADGPRAELKGAPAEGSPEVAALGLFAGLLSSCRAASVPPAACKVCEVRREEEQQEQEQPEQGQEKEEVSPQSTLSSSGAMPAMPESPATCGLPQPLPRSPERTDSAISGSTSQCKLVAGVPHAAPLMEQERLEEEASVALSQLRERSRREGRACAASAPAPRSLCGAVATALAAPRPAGKAGAELVALLQCVARAERCCLRLVREDDGGCSEDSDSEEAEAGAGSGSGRSVSFSGAPLLVLNTADIGLEGSQEPLFGLIAELLAALRLAEALRARVRSSCEVTRSAVAAAAARLAPGSRGPSLFASYATCPSFALGAALRSVAAGEHGDVPLLHSAARTAVEMGLRFAQRKMFNRPLTRAHPWADEEEGDAQDVDPRVIKLEFESSGSYRFNGDDVAAILRDALSILEGTRATAQRWCAAWQAAAEASSQERQQGEQQQIEPAEPDPAEQEALDMHAKAHEFLCSIFLNNPVAALMLEQPSIMRYMRTCALAVAELGMDDQRPFVRLCDPQALVESLRQAEAPAAVRRWQARRAAQGASSSANHAKRRRLAQPVARADFEFPQLFLDACEEAEAELDACLGCHEKPARDGTLYCDYCSNWHPCRRMAGDIEMAEAEDLCGDLVAVAHNRNSVLA
jgi:hypothetical protein